MHTNRLIDEKSPYLLQHAHNPVDWHPWGPEAVEKARAEDKPIFLSVGYSTCHWCHVMAHESFESVAIAEFLDANFVSIKVDREERPDVDRVYMAYVQATTGGGGWPMSVWLTPELKPFYGGTYFPPEDRWGRPGFLTVLQGLARAWKEKRAQIEEQGTQVIAALQSQAAKQAGGGPAGGLPADRVLRLGFEQIANGYDDERGGFSGAPKFPRPVSINFLLRYAVRPGVPEPDASKAKEMALHTLRAMADGGMHDQLGGGFHRYSVDAQWHVPHFEKMLYDQAQLVCAYLDAFQLTADPAFAGVARDVLDYVLRDMAHDDGGFYSAEDADSLLRAGSDEHAEGAFYVWTKAEIGKVLGGGRDAELFCAAYGVEPGGNAPEGSDPQGEFTAKNILIRRMSDAKLAEKSDLTQKDVRESLDAARKQLLAARDKRPRPHRDDKILTAWNGLMISAFARGYQVLRDGRYLQAAQRAAAFLKANLQRPDSGGLLRSFREGASGIDGFADDHAFLIQGLLDLWEADFDTGWLQWADALQAKQDALFAAPGGGYFSVSGNDKSILLRMKEDYDGAEPTPNSVSALNLLRMAEIPGNEDGVTKAKATIRGFSATLGQMPVALPQMLVALDRSSLPPGQVVVAGPRDAPGTRELLEEARRHFLPRTAVLLADGSAGQAWLLERRGFLRGFKPLDGKPAAYVCENFVCQLPVTSPADLRKLLVM